jgi:hypothetical protein
MEAAGMKRLLLFVFGFALLGAAVGAAIPSIVEVRGFARLDSCENPLVGDYVFPVGCGSFLGALTGFASAFFRRRFAAVWCLLAIAIPSLVAMSVAMPRAFKGDMERFFFWRSNAVGAITAIVMATSLAYWGHQRRQIDALSARPRPPGQPETL